MQDKRPYNDKQQPHGLWERYYDNEQLYCKGQFVNGEYHGPWEGYYTTGQLWYNENYIKGQRDGLLLRYNEDGTLREISFYAK
jgi:antitoxin component YwqK of YwqJK toxin-antitoxin module